MSQVSSPSKISWPPSTATSTRRSSGDFSRFSRNSPDSVSCSISYEHVHFPRELPCRHKVCMVYVKAKADQNQLFACPACSEVTPRLTSKHARILVFQPSVWLCANLDLKFAEVDNADSPDLPPHTLIMQTYAHTYLSMGIFMRNFA